MNNQFNDLNDLTDLITLKPELKYKQATVSWNPDAIDVTANPNKGRKSYRPTEKSTRIIYRTTEKSAISTPEPIIIIRHPEKSTYSKIEPGVKDSVLQSEDYKKWNELKNSYFFEPANIETTSQNVQLAGIHFICTKVVNKCYRKLIPEVDIKF